MPTAQVLGQGEERPRAGRWVLAHPAWAAVGAGARPPCALYRPAHNHLALCFPQIMIEFCPGGAVDAIMLGESSMVLVCGAGCSSV